MQRARFVLLAFAAVLTAMLLAAGSASAATVAIDALDDSPGSRWAPANVTITEGDTVEWNFDDALVAHDVASSSPNWSLSTPTLPPDAPPVSYTFDEPGTYTFLCSIHQPGMSGTVTVEPADVLDEVLVFSKTGGFRHDSIPQGIAAIQALGTANDFAVDATEDAAAFTDANLAQYDVVVFLSTTGEVLNADQQAAFERYIQGGGGFAGIHAASDTEYTWPWYGELVGGYFRSHPAGTPTATVEIEDDDEPSTDGLPASWTRVDEWYNFQFPTGPVVNGSATVADYSPRARHVKVLATVDESTYGEEDGNTIDDDHPVAWCSNFNGGRSWYTAMGHTQASFADADFRAHLLGGLQTAAGADADCGERRDPPPTADDFEKVTLNNDTNAPMEIDIANDGRAFYVELDGRVQMWSPTTQTTQTVGTIPVTLSHENGLLGIQLAPDFDDSGDIYLAYSALPDASGQNRVSRFTLTGDTLGQEQIIYTWQHQRQECCHTGGSLDFGPDGSLYLSTGDNTNPFAHGYNPTDERPGREIWDAQRTSGNTNSPNGKILRIKPIPDATGAPGVGSTYTIPDGNLFPVGTAQTLPEIYAMGFRNPFRIHVDQKTGWVLMGDYGPDAGSTDPNRGPQGSVEFNVIKQPGNYGWPYCVRENVPYNDITYTSDAGAGTNNGKYNCAAPVNNSPNNTGLTNLPPAQPATMWEAYSEADVRFPGLGTGGAPTGGPRYYFDEDNESDTKFPRFYDGQWFIGEWNNDWVKTASLNNEGLATGVACFAICTGYISPMDMEFGPDGSLYVVEWGQGFAENNPDSGVYRIDYTSGARQPVAVATATPDSGTLPLEVAFSSAGSVDPDGTPITYAWAFGDGETSTDPNPTHTYTVAGTYNATLTVTDESGATSVDTVTVVAGNSRPVVTIEIPENGKVADFGDTIPYEVSVTDAEDGSTAAGTIDCDDIRLEFKLGHDTHAHELSSATGCEGEFTISGVAGHGIDANIFTVITAAYTDEGAGAAGPVTGLGEAILQPKLKQAEYFLTTGRTADSRATEGDPGVTTEATTDVGGGTSAAFIEDGDWISFNPYNLEDLEKVTFRVASGGAGGVIELRYDAADGPLVVASPNIAPTGGWQTWQDVTVDLPDNVPAGTHRLFAVFRHPTATGSLMNLNYFKFAGKGAAITAPPEVTATSEPTSGVAPLDVAFDATATDAEGEAVTYAWDFGVPGTTTDTSTEEDPSYTYTTPGNYIATVTATDASGGKASATTEVRVTRPLDECPTGPVRSDEFDGSALDASRWTVLRPDAEYPLSVSGGALNLTVNNGSIYAGGTTAKNVVVQSTPEGEWEATAKITTTPLTENYQQAGLRVYAGDDNWASVHMISAGGVRDFEFIHEANGVPRNGAADKLGGIPADAPFTYYVRLTSDGTDLRASYSYDGNTFSPVGQPGSLSTFVDPKIGPAALSGDDPTTTKPVASFDWIRFDPDGTGGPGEPGGGSTPVDDFDGTSLGSAWNVVRQAQGLAVASGTLQIQAAAGDVYQGRNDAANLVMRAIPQGAWQAVAKVNFEGTAQYHQAGLILRGDDDNLVKLGRIAHTAAGDEKFEFISETNALARNEAADSTANIPAAFPDDYYVRITSDGTNVTGAYSTDGAAWTPVGRAAPIPANAQIGLFAFGENSTTGGLAAFDSFTLTTPDTGGGGPAGPSRDDQFDGGTLDKDRWNAIVRDTPAEYNLSGGRLNVTTSAGDIYTGDTSPPPNNFILQSADHAGADWVIETKISGATIDGGYAQGGLMAYVNGDNYVKLDAISDVDNPRINRLELRSEVAGAIATAPADPPVAAGTTDIWLRLTKTGTSYSGEYSFDGVAWSAFAAPVTNAMEAPAFGLFAFGPQAAGQGDLVPFDYFTLDGEDTPECECEGGSGDEFGGASLDEAKWDAIVRDDPTKYVVADDALTVTTVPGEIYRAGNPAGTGTLFMQSAAHAGADYVLETTLSGTITTGYSQGGIMVHGDDDNYVKLNAISDDAAGRINRIELRSEVAAVVPDGGPEIGVPAGTTKIGLRLTKTGQSYAAEVSFDGGAWTAISAPVTNAMAAPKLGLFTAGVNDSGDTVTFDYFSVDGSRGCPGEEPENTAPVLGDVTATPSSGFAPLPVAFTAAATDADDDALTYSWDFDGDGTADSSAQNPSHTYATAGAYNARVTVTDGEASVSRTVPVTVLAADDAEARFRVLVFSKTTGFRHDSIDEGIAAIRELGEEHEFQVDASEDATLFRDGVLSHYDTVVFLSTTGDPLNADQQAAFERYIRAGGGYTGIHAAADTEYEWTWYGQLVGAYFLSHPAGTPAATVRIDDPDHHSTVGLPDPWERVDEWYNYKSPLFAAPEVPDGDFSPRADVHVLATVDETTYGEDDGNATDDDHPISWCQRYDGGRSWYTGMGHTAASFAEADFLAHVLGGLEVSAGAVDDADCGVQPGGGGEPTVLAFADPASGAAPLHVNFSATGLDPDGGELAEYKWEFSDGGVFYGTDVSRTYTKKGTYTATVTVTDNEGDTASATVTVTVTTDGAAPEIVEALADKTEGPAPLDVLFQAVADDPDDDQLTYKWEFGDGGVAFGAEAEHTYLTKGSYEAKLTVSDPAGNTDTATIPITVADPVGNQPPSVTAAAVPQSGKAPLDVQLSAQGTDPDGDVLTYVWDFGDGSAGAAGRRARHVYTRNGVFTAKVTATDRAGNTATGTVAITVGNPAGGQAPTVQAAADPASGTGPLKVSFSAAASDPDGDAVTYEWDFGDNGKGGGPQVSHTYAAAGTYVATVKVTDPSGKSGTATVTVTVTAPVQGRGAVPQATPGAQVKTALASVSKPSLAAFRKRGLKVSATCGTDGTGAAALWASKATARKLGLTSRGLGRTTVECAAGETVRIALKPSRKVRKAIRAKKPSSLRITVALALQDGAPLQRTVTIAR